MFGTKKAVIAHCLDRMFCGAKSAILLCLLGCFRSYRCWYGDEVSHNCTDQAADHEA